MNDSEWQRVGGRKLWARTSASQLEAKFDHKAGKDKGNTRREGWAAGIRRTERMDQERSATPWLNTAWPTQITQNEENLSTVSDLEEHIRSHVN